MPVDWQERVLARIVHQDESARIIAERERVKERLRRLGTAFVDGLFDETEYQRQKKSLEWELETLLVPEVDAVKEAGRLLFAMPRLWEKATLQERHRLLRTTLDAVYIDTKDKNSIISVKAKPAFKAVFGVAGSTNPTPGCSAEFSNGTEIFHKSVFMVETGGVKLADEQRTNSLEQEFRILLAA